MSEVYFTSWSFGGETPSSRNHFHETAIREARIASEYHEVELARATRPSFLARLRLAFAGQPAADACNCPA